MVVSAEGIRPWLTKRLTDSARLGGLRRRGVPRGGAAWVSPVRPGSGSRSFGEDPHLGVLLLDVDGEVRQVDHQLVEVLGLELGDVDGYAVVAERFVDLVLGTVGDQAGQPHPGAKQLERYPDVDFRRRAAVGP